MIDEERLIEDFMNNYLVKNDGTWNDAMDRAVELAKTAPKIGGWIPCSERLPEEYGDYLVTYGFNDVDVKVVDVSSYSENGFEFINVIAWQPLPEAYHG